VLAPASTPIVNIARVFKRRRTSRCRSQPAYGAATVSNDLVFMTRFDGKLIALNRDSGSVLWEKQMPAGTDANVAIVGDTLMTAASFPLGKGQM
jgi:outer membrane protein assembly factor BamB